MSGAAVITVVVVLTQLVTIFGFVLVDRRQPVATLAWLMVVIFLPIVGVVLYLAFGMPRMIRRSRQLQRLSRRVEHMLRRRDFDRKVDPGDGDPAYADPRTPALVRLGRSLAGAPASPHNACDILVNAAATYRAMIEAIDAATDHIHVQFYIIQPDRTGEALRDHLVKRAKAGITVRVLVDGVGSIALPNDFWRALELAGGEAAVFSPVGLWSRLRRRDRIDFRNHRKSLIVDGRIGFTGGINVGQEYLGLNPDLGHWRDTHMRIEGPAVLKMQRCFIEDWLNATEVLLDDERYVPEPHSAGSAAVQIIDSGPDRHWSPIHQLYFSAISLAQGRVWITSPYFVPDAAIEEALVSCALRGVDVRLLVPSKSDSAFVGAATRSYYPRLLDAGARIFEYARGFVHAKTLVVDSWVATIGSANMDIRSFHLNYELNAFVYEQRFVEELAEVFLEDLRDAEEIPDDAVTKLSYPRRLGRAVARLMSPLL